MESNKNKLADNFGSVEMVLTSESTEKELVYKSLAEVIEGYKFYAIYFAEKTCPGVKDFTDMLCEFYHEVNKDGAKNVQIVLLNLDIEDNKEDKKNPKPDDLVNSYVNFKEVLKKGDTTTTYECMPWVAVPYTFPGK